MYTGHSVVIHPDGASAAVLVGGITQMSGATNTTINAEETAGSPYALNTHTTAQKPQLRFSTRDVKKAIDTLGFVGLVIKGATNPGVELWQALQENGITKAGTVHKKMTVKNGRAVIRRISMSHQEDALAECEVLTIHDGTNAPLIPSAASLALPGVPADPARYTIHSVTFGGIEFKQIQNLDIDFGMSIETMGGSSDVWDSQVLISKLAPVITFRSTEVSKFLATGGVGLTGLAGSHANTVIKLRKRAMGAVPFVADATAEHITITTAGIVTFDDVLNASGNQRAEDSLRITTRFDGTNVPLIFDTAAALTGGS